MAVLSSLLFSFVIFLVSLRYLFSELQLLLSFPQWRRIILNASVKKQGQVKAGNCQVSSGR